MTATKFKQSTGSKFNHPHMIIPSEDTTWAVEQKPCVLKFWQQCWLADPFGSRWMKLVTNLSDSAFRLARRVLEAASLFMFRRISSGSDGRTSIWEVKNLHGARVKEFWQGEKNEANTASNKADTTPSQADTARNEPDVAIQNQPEQAFDEPSETPHEHITNSSKEFVMCESSVPTVETANAPLEGTSPSNIGVEEDVEESPTASDEKWSSAALFTNDAIAARSKSRPMRIEKLKMARLLAENPGFDFLLSCWQDDPAMRIVIKELLLKFTQWGIVCVDGELVNCNK
ncbi:hypothetical protein [Nostoc sp.]